MDNDCCDSIIFLKKEMFIRERLYSYLTNLSASIESGEIKEEIDNFLKEIDVSILEVDPALHSWCQGMLIEAEIIRGILNEKAIEID